MADVHLGIDVETSSVVQADQQLGKLESRLRGAQGGFAATGASARDASQGIRGVADAGKVVELQVSRTAEEMRRLNAINAASHSHYTRMRGAVQNVAFQLQDITVQMQMGTSAARSLGIQLPQLLGGFGALGATIGLIAGITLPLFSNSIDDAIKSLGRLNALFLQSSAGQVIGDVFSVLGSNIDHILVAAASLATFMAGKWVVSFVAARAAAASLTGTLVALGSVMVRLGIGALVIAAGELVYVLIQLRRETGSWGEALSVLGEVADGVWEGISTSATAIRPALGAVWAGVKVDFLNMTLEINLAWRSLLESIGASTASAEAAFNSIFSAMQGAQGDQSRLAADAASRVSDGFAKAAEAAARLKGLTGDISLRLGGGLNGEGGGGGAAGAAKNLNDELEKIVKPSEAFTKELERQKKLADDIVMSLRGLAFGTMTGAEGIGGVISALTDSAFGQNLNAAFEDAAETLAKSFSKAMSGLNNIGLSDFAVASVGTGIGIAATGVLNGNAQQIGGGIGSAIGGAVGSSLTSSLGGTLGALGGPLGMVLGGLAGGLISRVFGGGNDDKWKPTSGTVFSGTTFAQTVTTQENVNTERDVQAAGRLAFQGTRRLLADFNRELAEYVRSTGQTVESGSRIVVNQTRALKAITGFTREIDIEYAGPEGAAIGEKISQRVGEIMALAGSLVASSGPPLTEAQQLWRATQAKFSSTNMAILRDLGFTSREIYEAQADIKKDLAQGFNKEMLDTIVDSGRATRAELDHWKAYELANLAERRIAALNTAREIGASTLVVASAFRAERARIEKEWREMLSNMAQQVAVGPSRLERLSFGAEQLRSRFDLMGDSASHDPASIRRWATLQRAIVEEQRKVALVEARRLGQSVLDVNRRYNWELVQVERQKGELLTAAARAAAERQVDAITAVINRLQERLSVIEERRSDVLQELTRRADEARRAEQSLAEARRSIAGGELNPGGPMDRFNALRGQFNAAITGARGGNADAAQQAASLAQSLLQAGRGVFASGTGYADLFTEVNRMLRVAQRSSGAAATTIEKQLDANTFSKVTEQSTQALLRALGQLNASIRSMERRIDAQTKSLELAQQKQRVGAA